MYSYIQHQNLLCNADHAKDINAPVNGGYEVVEDDFLEYDINNYLSTPPEENNREFVIGGDAFKYP